MAATVSGVFRIYDRATGPLKRMEEQARRTQRAFGGLGDTMDKSATQQQARRYEETNQQIRNLGRTSRTTDRDMDVLGRRMQRTSKHTEDLTTRLAKLGGAFYGLQKIISIIKLPAMAAGIGLLVKWVGALAGGVVALLPKLTDLVGVVGAAPATFVGLGLAVGSVKLAFQDFGKALGGNQKALKNLTPEARHFLATVKQYQPVMKELRQSAQRGLFPGLDESLRRAQRAVPTLRRLLEASGRTVGQGVSRFTTSMTSGKALADLSDLGRIGNKVISRMFDAVTSLARAFMSFGVAAGPFTGWLSKTIKDGAHSIQVMTDHARATGRLGQFFDRTKHAMQTFGSILHNLWDTFKGVGHAARSLGDDLWRSADRTTKKWAEWTNSASGQNTLRSYFDSIRGTLHETFGLVGDLSKAIFRLSGDSSMGNLVRKLREMVPLVEKILGQTSQQLGGPLLDAVKAFLTVFSETPYFGTFVRLLAQMANLVGWLIQKLPAIQPLIMAFTAWKLFGPAITGVRNLAAAWGLTATNATAAAGAQSAAVAAAGGAGMVGGGAAALGLRGRYAASRAGGVAPGQQMTLWGPASQGPAGRVTSGARAISPTIAAGGAAVAGAARAFWPIAALFGLAGGVGAPAGVGNFLQGAASGATMGLIPAPTTLESKQSKLYTDVQRKLLTGGGTAELKGGIFKRDDTFRVSGLAGGDNPNFRQARSSIPGLQRQISSFSAIAAAESGDEAKNTLVVVRALEDQLRLRKAITAEHQRQTQQRSVAHAADTLTDIQRAFGIDTKHGGASRALSIAGRNAYGAIRGSNSMAGREAIGQGMLDWARNLEKHGGPKDSVRRTVSYIRRAFSEMGKHVAFINGQIFTNSRGEWSQIAGQIGSKAEEALRRTGGAFAGIAGQARRALTLMGFDKGRASALVKAVEHGGLRSKQASDIIARSPGGGRNPTPYAPGYTPGAPSGGPSDGPRRPGPVASSASKGGGSVAGGVSGAASTIMQQFPGLSITSGFRPGDPGYHGRGLALDLAGPPGTMNTAATWIAQNMGGSLLEGIHNPGLSVKNGANVPPGFWGAATWADHADHIHIALAGAAAAGAATGAAGGNGGGAAAQIAALVAPKSGMGGAPGTLLDSAAGLYAAGMTKAINQRLGQTGGGAASAGGSYNASSLAQLWIQAGGPPGASRLAAAVALAESGGNPNAVGKNTNGTFDRGLWQINSIWGAKSTTDPLANAQAAVSISGGGTNWSPWVAYTTGAYQKFLGGKQKGGPAMAGWFGTEGTVTASQPTILGIGDGHGSETAVITRGKPGGGVRIGKLVIQNHRPGDVRRQIKQEIEQAFNDLADTLGSMPTEDDTEVMA